MKFSTPPTREQIEWLRMQDFDSLEQRLKDRILNSEKYLQSVERYRRLEAKYDHLRDRVLAICWELEMKIRMRRHKRPAVRRPRLKPAGRKKKGFKGVA